MAAGVPVVATRVGALAELDGDAELVAPGDVAAMAAAIARVAADATAGDRAARRPRPVAPHRTSWRRLPCCAAYDAALV